MLRNLSPQTMFEKLALEHKPLCRFDAKKQGFAAWKAKTWPKVYATLGDFPEKVPLNPQLLAEWEEDDLRKQRWIIDVGRHISATFQGSSDKSVGENGEDSPQRYGDKR